MELLEAKLIWGEADLYKEIYFGFASDLMSDVLTLDSENILLLTGLANLQVMRTAEMADIHCVVLVRGKKATSDMRELAKENNIVLLETDYSMFRSVSVLSEAGLEPVY